MKNFAAILAITVIILGLTPGFSYAELNSDWEAWNHIDLGSVGLQNEGSVSEDEQITVPPSYGGYLSFLIGYTPTLLL
jgi:hypothetical protein